MTDMSLPEMARILRDHGWTVTEPPAPVVRHGINWPEKIRQDLAEKARIKAQNQQPAPTLSAGCGHPQTAGASE